MDCWLKNKWRGVTTSFHTFLDPWFWPKGSYKVGSVLSSVREFSLRFSLNFLIYSCVWQPDILEKIPIGKKCPQNRVFRLFKKIMSLVLSGICVKRKLWFINVLRKLHAWEKSGSQVIAKNESRPMRFQYSLIVNILLID